jgi:hypothetical protein
MSAFDWLKTIDPSIPDYSPEEREAISDFTLLWSMFESRVLDNSANAKAIMAAVKQWHDGGALNAKPFADTLAYLCSRYFQNGQPTFRFHHLHLRQNDMPDLVRDVLSGKPTNVADECTVVFIVIYRFRNSLFHGHKWAYAIQEQLENFSHSNAALKRALQIVGLVI